MRMFSEHNENRIKIGQEVTNILKGKVGSLEGKRILDVGCRTGENSWIMQKNGAEVYGIDPDKEAIQFSISKGYLSKERGLACTAQDLPKNLYGTFDFVTVWLFCINYNERDDFFSAISKSIKQNGTVIISVADDVFAEGPASIKPFLSKYFDLVTVTSGNGWNKYIFTCTSVEAVLEMAASKTQAIPQPF